MKILVSGGAGFIGSRIVTAYINAGHDVIIIDDLSTGKTIHPKARFYHADITSNLHDVFVTEKPDIVNHLAAQVSVNNSIENVVLDATINIIGSINLLETCVSHGIKKFIYSSSASVYGEPIYLPIDEKHPIDPISPYGISKHTVEHYLYYYYKNYGLNYSILRYSNVYGYGDKTDVISIFIKRMLANDDIYIYGDGQQMRDFINVSDVVNANLQVIMDRNKCNIYNIGSGNGISILDLFYKLRKITGYTKEPIFTDAKSGDIKRMIFDTRKAAGLNWKAYVDLDTGLRDIITDYVR